MSSFSGLKTQPQQQQGVTAVPVPNKDGMSATIIKLQGRLMNLFAVSNVNIDTVLFLVACTSFGKKNLARLFLALLSGEHGQSLAGMLPSWITGMSCFDVI